MLHKHHIIPKHFGGTDHPSNIEYVTVEEHADRHKVLFENHGRWQDKIAYMCLSGQIGNDEAIRQAGIFANTGRIISSETRRKMSESHIGLKSALGTKRSPEQVKEQSIRMIGNQFGRNNIGKIRTYEHKLRYSRARRGTPTRKEMCPHCDKLGGVSAMKRWHFNNCKNRKT